MASRSRGKLENNLKFSRPLSPFSKSVLTKSVEEAFYRLEFYFGLRNLSRQKVFVRFRNYIYAAKDFRFATFVRMVSSGTLSLFRESLKKRSGASFRFRLRRRFFALMFEPKLRLLIKNWEKSKSNLVQIMTSSHDGDLEKHLQVATSYLEEKFKIYFFKNLVNYLLKAGLKDHGLFVPEESLKKLSLGHGRNFATQMALDFADERITYNELMVRYGHMTDNWDLSAPIFQELPPLPRNFQAFNKIKEDLRKRRHERLDEVENIRKVCNGDREMMSLVSYFEELLLIDEELSAFGSLQYPEVKGILKSLEQKWGLAAGDIYFLTIAEIQSERFTLAHIEERKREYKTRISQRASFEGKPKKTSLRGECVSAGLATGRALIVETIEDLRRLKEDSILVLRSTAPTYVAYYSGCRGIVSEAGGVLSHGAIVAREFGVPMVSEVADAFKYIREGDRLEIDAHRGLIKPF